MAIEKSNRNARNFAVGILFILAFFFVINPLTRTALGIYLFFLLVVLIVYSLRDYQKTLIGMTSKRLLNSILIAGGVGIGFWIVTKFIPSFSILYPSLPGDISNSLRAFIVIGVAGPVEELFFRGSLLGYLRSFIKPSKKRIWLSVIITALVFSIFHIIAYAGEIYTQPGFSSILTSFNANISAFISAFIIGILFGYLAVKTDNLATPIVSHILLNFIIYTSLAVVF